MTPALDRALRRADEIRLVTRGAAPAARTMARVRGDLARLLAEAEELQLTTRGRHTGRAHTVTLWFAYEDGVLWLRTDQRPDGRGPDWYKNLLRDPWCRIRIDGHELAGTFEPVDDREAGLRHLVELWRAKYGAMWVSDWYVERGRLPVKVRLDTAP